MLQTAGAWDPAAGVGVAFRFGSQSPFSGLSHRPGGTTDSTACCRRPPPRPTRPSATLSTSQVGQHISDEAYAPFILAFAPSSIVTTTVHGPGLTTPIPPLVVNTGVLWDEVWIEQ